MIREVQKEAKEYRYVNLSTPSLPEREEMSMEEVSELLEDHSRRLHECETAQKQLQQQFSDLSHLVNTSLLSAFSQPSGPGSKNPVSSITLVPDELSGIASRQAKKESVPPKQWQDSLTSPLDDNALVPPLVTVSDLPPLAHRPVEEGSLEQWDDAQVDALVTSVSRSLRQWVRERQQSLLLKRQLLLQWEERTKVFHWYEDEVRRLEVRKRSDCHIVVLL